jgi:hypothetical protein
MTPMPARPNMATMYTVYPNRRINDMYPRTNPTIARR